MGYHKKLRYKILMRRSQKSSAFFIRARFLRLYTFGAIYYYDTEYKTVISVQHPSLQLCSMHVFLKLAIQFLRSNVIPLTNVTIV